MVAEALAVIGRDDDQRLAERRQPIEAGEQRTEHASV